MSYPSPVDTDAERGVLANLLLSQDAKELADNVRLCGSDGIGQDHFSDPSLKRLWDALGQSVKDGNGIDHLALATKANIEPRLLAELQGELSTSINFQPLRGRVRVAYVAREMVLLGQNAIEAYHRRDFEPTQFLGQLERLKSMTASKGLVRQLSDALLTRDQLDTMKITPRECFMGDWLREGSLGFVYGQRGEGKTYWMLGLVNAIAGGGQFGPWRAGPPQRVTVIDGEMPLETIQKRNHELSSGTGNVDYLNHEVFFERTNKSLNLTNPETQDAIVEMLLQNRSRVLVLDNLSCLFWGMGEDKADEWEKVMPWLLRLRRLKIVVIIVHHSGKNPATMRGTSRREDAAFWVIQIAKPSDTGERVKGALKFVSRFTKNRDGTEEEAQSYEWTFEITEGVRCVIAYKRISPLDELKQLLRDGLKSCSDIAEEMKVSKGKVSKLATKAKNEGWLKINGREYELNEPL